MNWVEKRNTYICNEPGCEFHCDSANIRRVHELMHRESTTTELLNKNGRLRKRFIAGLTEAAELSGPTSRSQIRFYLQGLEGRLPPEFESIYKNAKKSLDPEWEEYLRLKEKFGE